MYVVLGNLYYFSRPSALFLVGEFALELGAEVACSHTPDGGIYTFFFHFVIHCGLLTLFAVFPNIWQCTSE